jgi:hypothetical protein
MEGFETESGAGSVLVTNGSGCGSGRPKNIRILWIRILNIDLKLADTGSVLDADGMMLGLKLSSYDLPIVLCAPLVYLPALCACRRLPGSQLFWTRQLPGWTLYL